MARKKSSLIVCKKCGESWKPKEVPTVKEWSMTSPMPDKNGNVTITMMATWRCPSCGATARGTLGKTKGERTGPSKREIIMEALRSDEDVDLVALADAAKSGLENVLKIIPLLAKKEGIPGKLVGNTWKR